MYDITKRYLRARVWLDEEPPARFDQAVSNTTRITTERTITATRDIAAIEIAILQGGKTSYALLGGPILPSDISGLTVISYLASLGPPFASPIAIKPEEVRLGVHPEFAHAVTSGFERVATSAGCPTNATLTLRWSAHGLVGSSQNIFERTSAILHQLLSFPPDASQHVVESLIEPS